MRLRARKEAHSISVNLGAAACRWKVQPVILADAAVPRKLLLSTVPHCHKTQAHALSARCVYSKYFRNAFPEPFWPPSRHGSSRSGGGKFYGTWHVQRKTLQKKALSTKKCERRSPPVAPVPQELVASLSTHTFNRTEARRPDGRPLLPSAARELRYLLDLRLYVPAKTCSKRCEKSLELRWNALSSHQVASPWPSRLPTLLFLSRLSTSFDPRNCQRRPKVKFFCPKKNNGERRIEDWVRVISSLTLDVFGLRRRGWLAFRGAECGPTPWREDAVSSRISFARVFSMALWKLCWPRQCCLKRSTPSEKLGVATLVRKDIGCK